MLGKLFPLATMWKSCIPRNIQVGIPRARRSLVFAQAIPLGKRNNDPILLIKKDEFVEIAYLAGHPTNR